MYPLGLSSPAATPRRRPDPPPPTTHGPRASSSLSRVARKLRDGRNPFFQRPREPRTPPPTLGHRWLAPAEPRGNHGHPAPSGCAAEGPLLLYFSYSAPNHQHQKLRLHTAWCVTQAAVMVALLPKVAVGERGVGVNRHQHLIDRIHHAKLVECIGVALNVF